MRKAGGEKLGDGIRFRRVIYGEIFLLRKFCNKEGASAL
jgi:hypothetical protein